MNRINNLKKNVILFFGIDFTKLNNKKNFSNSFHSNLFKKIASKLT